MARGIGGYAAFSANAAEVARASNSSTVSPGLNSTLPILGCTISGLTTSSSENYVNRKTPVMRCMVGLVASRRLSGRAIQNAAIVKPGTEVFAPHQSRYHAAQLLGQVIRDEHGRYPAGTWLRNPAGSKHSPFSAEGCTIYVKTGHLPLVATSGSRNYQSKESSHAKIHH